MTPQTKPIGPRTQAHVDTFLDAVKGLPLAEVKKVLMAMLFNLHFPETSKKELALRIAKGKLSKGGSSESQRIRRLDVDKLKTACRVQKVLITK